MSYLVMECHPGYVVLLDEEGRFLKAANLRYETGQTVYDPVLMRETPEKQRHTIRWIGSSIAAIAACFLIFFGISYYQSYIQPYSFIYLTINPAVQMDLNRQGTVVGLTGTNEDGQTLLKGYDGKGKDKVTVADELIDRAIEMGFLSEGGQVSFSIDSPDDTLFQKYGTELRTKVTEHLDGRITVTIEIVNHKNEQGQDPESGSPDISSQSAYSPQNSLPATVSQPSSGTGGYGDSDYGAAGGRITDATPPSGSTTPVDSDYASGSDGDTDYTNGETDYDPGNDTGNDDDPDDDTGNDDDPDDDDPDDDTSKDDDLDDDADDDS